MLTFFAKMCTKDVRKQRTGISTSKPILSIFRKDLKMFVVVVMIIISNFLQFNGQ